jgi:hypothetical protein
METLSAKSNNPLGLPRGSVRACLALAAIGATIAQLFLRPDIPDAWWAIMASISTYYFTQREE